MPTEVRMSNVHLFVLAILFLLMVGLVIWINSLIQIEEQGKVFFKNCFEGKT